MGDLMISEAAALRTFPDTDTLEMKKSYKMGYEKEVPFEEFLR